MILVTGGTGLVGSHLLYRFRESELTINAIYRTKASIDKTRQVFESYRAGDAALVDNINWIKADILDLPSMEIAMEGIATVYHCAAALEAATFDQMKCVNVTGTQYIVDLSIANKVQRFCYVSSIATLGNPILSQAINEEDFFNPDALNTDYAISKYGGEMEVWRASQEGLPVIIVNPGIIIGEGNYNSGSGQLFYKTFKNQPFYTAGSSGIVDVRDVATIMQELTESMITGERYILVSENRTYKSLLDEISKGLKKKKPTIKLNKWMLYIVYILLKLPSLVGWSKGLNRAQISSYTSKSKYDNSKIKAALNFEFIPLADSIDRVAAHFKKSIGY